MLHDSYSIRGLGMNIADASVGGLYGVTPYWRASPEMFERVEVLNEMAPGGSVGGSINLMPKHTPEQRDPDICKRAWIEQLLAATAALALLPVLNMLVTERGLPVATADLGTGFGLVAWNGHISLAAGLVFSGLLLHNRWRETQR